MDPNASLDDIIKQSRKAKVAKGPGGKAKKLPAAKRNSPAKKTVRGRGPVGGLRSPGVAKGGKRVGVKVGGLRSTALAKKRSLASPAAVRKNRVAQQLIKKALLLRREAARSAQRPGTSRAALALPRATPARVKRAAKARAGRAALLSPAASDVHSRLGGGRGRKGPAGARGGGRGGAKGRLGGRLGQTQASPRGGRRTQASAQPLRSVALQQRVGGRGGGRGAVVGGMRADAVAAERAAIARERRALQSRAANAEAAALQRERAALARERQLLQARPGLQSRAGRQGLQGQARQGLQSRAGRQGRQPAFDVVGGVAKRRRGASASAGILGGGLSLTIGGGAGGRAGRGRRGGGGGGASGGGTMFQQQIRSLVSPQAGRGVAIGRGSLAAAHTGRSLNDRFGGGQRASVKVRGGRAKARQFYL